MAKELWTKWGKGLGERGKQWVGWMQMVRKRERARFATCCSTRSRP